MRYYCRGGEQEHPCATAYCDEHDCDTVRDDGPEAVDSGAMDSGAVDPARSAGDGGAAGNGPDGSDPIADLLRRPLTPPAAAPRPGDGTVELPPGVKRRYRLLDMLPPEAAVGGRLWLAAPVGSPHGMVLLKVHAHGFRPGLAKDRLRERCAEHGVVDRLDGGVETLSDGSRTVTWETWRLPGGGTLRKMLDDALTAPEGPPGRLGGLPEPAVRALLSGLADLLEAWEREAGAVPVNLSPDTLYLRTLGGVELVLPDLDGAAVLGEDCARGPRPPLTRYLAPAHLVEQGRWSARSAWASAAAVVGELLTGRPGIPPGTDPDDLPDALLHRPAADTGDPHWDELLDRLTGGRLDAAGVRAWCAEQAPGAASVEPFRYGDLAFDDPAELVSALVDSGTAGSAWLGDPEHAGALAEWLEARVPSADRSPLDRFLRSPSGPYAPERALAGLAATFLRGIPPRFWGDVIDEDGLLALAARQDAATLSAVLDSGVLRDAARQTCARHGGEAGCPVLRGLEEKVTRALETARQETDRTVQALERERQEEGDALRAEAAAHLVPNGPAWYDRDTVLTRVVRLLLGDDAFLGQCRERLSRARPGVGTPRWWGRLHDAATGALGRERSGPPDATATGLLAAALAFDQQIVVFRRGMRRARLVDTRQRVGTALKQGARGVRTHLARSPTERADARDRRRASLELAHRRLLTLRWLWLAAFTLGLLDVIGYSAFGWVPYSPPPTAASAGLAPSHPGVRVVTAAARALHPDKKHPATSHPDKHPTNHPAKSTAPSDDPLWRSRDQLWHEARIGAPANADHMIISLRDFSDGIGDKRPEWADDGAFLGAGTRVPAHLPWLLPVSVLLACAAGLRWAVRGRGGVLRLGCAAAATLATVALLWHLWADGLTHTLLAVAYSLDFWHGTLWVLLPLAGCLYVLGKRGTRPLEVTARSGTGGASYGSSYGR
ncbi:hypothetical protein [Streptomyces sp. NBC_00670]|uniref:hypothetical protein n=1 Tax=Streptomyces sp. NBC_00670 TaxID=2975804 RepID=UPI002E306147|nr:hypothetical protein [Streptomyces sp. NBC_00670]